MSDWIPVPEFENVLIVLAELADTPEAIAENPAMSVLQSLKNWTNGTVYLFHAPPEAGEVLEDVDPEMAAQFALAAQMTEDPAEVCRDALRRVFSRSVVQRVLVVQVNDQGPSVDRIDRLFADLAAADLVWAGEWPHSFALGMKQFYGEIFSDLETARRDLRKVVDAYAQDHGLVTVHHDAL